MKQYLERFFKDFEYPKEDAEFLLKAYDTVVSNDTANGLLESILKMYEENELCDFTKILELSQQIANATDIHPYTTDLLVTCCLTKHAWELYEKRGLDYNLFRDTMLDFRYKLEECKAVKGICGTFVAWWFDLFFQLKRFCFGRLQFEVIKFEHNYEKDGIVYTPDSLVLNTHIPRTGTPMDMDSCREAYERAKEFFKDELGEHPAAVCESWLLFPEHPNFLPAKSNILKFMAEYDIIDSGYNRSESELWRLFDTEEKNPNRLPTDSSLRRAYVDHLKANKRTGWGFGIKLL